MAPRTITPEESDLAQRLLANARKAMTAIGTDELNDKVAASGAVRLKGA